MLAGWAAAEETGVAFYRRPPRLTKTINRCVSWFASLGLTPSDTGTLEVRGQRSGRQRSTVLTWAEYQGDRYLVSLRGEAQWVRNVRAASGEAIIRHRGRRRVRLVEVPVKERAPILKAYISKRALSKSPERSARQYFGVAKDASIEELEPLAPGYPVFRIEKVA